MINKGFTLIETLIAILVLMLAISGPLTLAAKGLQVTLIAKDQNTALYLAQDAVEYVRWARDTNRLNGLDWLLGGSISGSSATMLGLCISADGSAKCYFDSSVRNPATAPPSCVGSPVACPVMLNNPVNNDLDYVSSGGTNSIFTRTVSILTPVGGNSGEASILVTVTWYDQGSLQRTVTVREHIFSWQ